MHDKLSSSSIEAVVILLAVIGIVCVTSTGISLVLAPTVGPNCLQPFFDPGEAIESSFDAKSMDTVGAMAAVARVGSGCR